jgi:preprotein translocase subunit SecG
MNLLLILIIIISAVLVLFVLVQNPKGGGLNSEFGSTAQLGGAKRATDILEKGTWALAIGMALLCLVIAPNYAGENVAPSGENTEIGVSSDSATEDAAE